MELLGITRKLLGITKELLGITRIWLDCGHRDDAKTPWHRLIQLEPKVQAERKIPSDFSTLPPCNSSHISPTSSRQDGREAPPPAPFGTEYAQI